MEETEFFSQDPQMITAHFGEEYQQYYNAIVPPVFMNSLNVFKTIDEYYDADKFDKHTYIYGRVSNPTVRIVEEKITALEHGCRGILFASGMAAATTAVLGVCHAGSHVVCVRNAYGPLRVFLQTYCTEKMHMQVTFVKGDQVSEFEDAVTDETDLIILESPSSVVFSIQDLRAVAALAKKHGAKTYIDNTYCTPLLQTPLDMGIDLVMHTASKYFGGHSDLIGGVLVGRDDALMRELLGTYRELFGGIMGPMEAWLILRGLRTLDVRLERHGKTALEVAQYLEKHPRVKMVHYPMLDSHPQYALMRTQQTGCSGLMSFELDCTTEQAKTVTNSLRVFKIGVSWGGFESLVCMPHLRQTDEENQWFGAGRNLLRIHCGLEGTQHLLEDLEQALKTI